MIHLDTNVAITILNGRSQPVRTRFDAASETKTPIFMSAIVFNELMYGAANSQRPIQNEEKVVLFISSDDINILPFDTKDDAIAGSIRAMLRQAGELIGPYDLLKAAQTIKAGAILITANTREFNRIPGLTVVDWAI